MPTGTSAPRMIRTTVWMERERERERQRGGEGERERESERDETTPDLRGRTLNRGRSCLFHPYPPSSSNEPTPRLRRRLADQRHGFTSSLQPKRKTIRNGNPGNAREYATSRAIRRSRVRSVPRRNPEIGGRKEEKRRRKEGGGGEGESGWRSSRGRLGYWKALERSRRWGPSCRRVGGWAPLAGFVRGALAAVSPRGPYFKTVPNQARQSL